MPFGPWSTASAASKNRRPLSASAPVRDGAAESAPRTRESGTNASERATCDYEQIAREILDEADAGWAGPHWPLRGP
jgi:hypothetical protein